MDERVPGGRGLGFFGGLRVVVESIVLPIDKTMLYLNGKPGNLYSFRMADDRPEQKASVSALGCYRQ
jgi:hypothetical protein